VTKENDALRKKIASIEMPFVSHRGVQTDAQRITSKSVETGDQDDLPKTDGDGIDRDAVMRDLQLQQLQQQSLLQERWNEELRQQLIARDAEERALKELLLARLKVMEDELKRLMGEQYQTGAVSNDQLNTRDLLMRVEELNAIIRRSLGENVADPVTKVQPVQRSTDEIIRGEPVPGMPGFHRPAPGQGYDDDDIIIGPALPTDGDSAPRIYYLHTERNKAKIPLPPAPQTPIRNAVPGGPNTSSSFIVPKQGAGSFVVPQSGIQRNW